MSAPSMTNNNLALTRQGMIGFKSELSLLKRYQKKVAAKLKDALKDGNLKENIQWMEAQKEYQLVLNRIDEVEQILSTSKIIYKPETIDSVCMGSKVYIENVKDHKDRLVYQIVSSVEADPSKGKISDVSLMGEALLGLRVGQVATIRTAYNGEKSYRIRKIE